MDEPIMNSLELALVERLSDAGNPHERNEWENQDGYYLATCRVSAEDIPSLIDVAQKWGDCDWPGELVLPQVDDVELLPITAWRALADLKAEDAVQPLIDMVCELDDEYDDWSCEDLPHVFGKIGKSAIEPLINLATSDDKAEHLRSMAASGLRRVADYHPDVRERIVACLTEMMANARDGFMNFNTTVLSALVDLGAVEAAEPIERAFAANLLDVGMNGNWEEVRRLLGVEGLGLPMPVSPHNSIAELRMNMGIGIFSDLPIFALGETDPDAEQAYYERAYNTFSKSDEARQIVERHGDLGWFHTLLEFGITYCGETVDAMSLTTVEEFVLEHVPRKVSTGADSAASIIDELAAFWEYLERVYQLPAASSIVEWLKSDGLADRLKASLSNPANFGMAKSFVMAGQQAGYDMTTTEGTATFMAQYNQSLLPSQPAAAPAAREQRVGRNAPCPCGSGKKFKKCCGSRT